MNQQQSDKLKALETNQKLYQDNTAKYSGIGAIVSAVSAQDVHILNLKKYRTIQDADYTGLAGGKKQLRVKTTTELLVVSGALVAYGTINGDSAMVNKYNYSETELNKKRDDDFIDAAEEAANTANPLIAALTAATGLTSTQLGDLVTDTASLYIANTTPEQARNQVKIATANIEEIFPLTDELHENLLEPLMRTNFFTADPDFYRTYLESLQIVDTGHRFDDVHGFIFDGASQAKIGKTIITVYDRNNNDALVMTLKSGEKGFYRIKELPAGNYKFRFQHPDYQVKEENVNKGDGINIKRNFSMDHL